MVIWSAVGSIEVTTVLVVSLLLIVESTVLDERRLSALIGEAGMVDLVIEIGRHSWIEAEPVVHGIHKIVMSGGDDGSLAGIGREIGGARVTLGV